MKKTIFLLFILFLNLNYGQNLINNHWKLGQTDLNFSNAVPTASVTNNNNYAYATASDSNGNVLFSTNGVDVWDKNNNIMFNGYHILQDLITGPNSYGDDVLNTIIVPNPGNKNQYYIFTSYNLKCLCGVINKSRYVYSIVEFNASQPLGYVVDIGNTDTSTQYGTTTYTKYLKDVDGNTLSPDFYYGALTSTKTIDNNIWVIVQYKNEMLSYRVDNLGFNPIPVVSTFSSNQIYLPGVFSQEWGLAGNQGEKIRIAPSNNFLIGIEYSEDNNINQYYPSSRLYKLSFNSSTGIFSNYELYSNLSDRVYDFEISNDSEKLYYIRKQTVPNSQTIYGQVAVKNLTNNSTPVRLLNEYNSSTTSTSGFSSIQKDRNDNILLTSYSTLLNKNKHIHKIENQNDFNLSSVNINFVSLNNYTIYRLPQIIPELVSSCEQSLVLNSEPNSNYSYINYSSIISQNGYSLNSSQNIGMYASDYILLKPETTITSGATYIARILPCNLYGERVSNNLEDEKIDTKVKYDNFLVYPNPNNGLFSIKVPFIKDESFNLYVIDLSGKIIYQNNYDKEQINISLQNIENGIYFIKIESSNYNKTIKFIKE